MPSLYSPAFATALLAGISAPVFLQPAIAQETVAAAPASEQREGVIAFTPADFAAARPNTALEMVNRLPGFSLEAGEQVRGFAGAAGNVLIDGQRPTIKTDSLADTLGRIPIEQVERIELIRGGAPGIDMQGRTVMANVIRKKIDTFQQVLALGAFVFADTGKSIPNVNYQATRRAGEHQLDFQLGRGVSLDDSMGDGIRTTLNVATGDVLLQKMRTESDGVPYSARASYKGPFAGGVFSANGLIGTDEFKNEQRFYDSTSDERFVSRSANDRGEIGLNYKRKLGEAFELETLGLSKIAFGTAKSTGAAGGSASLFEIEAEAGETIGRGIARYTHSPKLSFEGGGELAFNYREQQVGLTVNGAPVALPASDVRIEELRGEAFLQGSWRPDPTLSVEGGVRVERSTITQSGDTNRERSFTYPKPRFVATWSPTKSDQVRLRIEREIGQLNFQDFISNVNLNTNVLSAGNAALEPDKTWAYEIAFEKRFWGNAAAVLTLRHEDISDVSDVFPFVVQVDADRNGVPDDSDGDGKPDERLVSGPGNIGDGTTDIIDFNLTLPLDKVGIKGGELKVKSLFREGEVRDPLTGRTRVISGQRPDDVSISYRQDLPEQKLSFGLNWFAGWQERYYTLEQEERLEIRNFWSSFVEYKPSSRFTLRAELNNLDPFEFEIQRRIFDGPRGGSGLALVETERRQSQMLALIRARWSFG